MTTVYITAGVSGSGKSTEVARRLEEDARSGLESIRYSSDYIREMFPEITNDNSKVFKVMNDSLKDSVKSGQFDNIYYDATNTSRRRRRALYRNIKSWNRSTKVVVLFFSVPFKLALKRNNERDRKVPKDAIWRQHGQLQVPRMVVDCDLIEVCGVPLFNAGYVESVENPTTVQSLLVDINDYCDEGKYWFEELGGLIGLKHDCSPWHEEDVDKHIDMAINNSDDIVMKKTSLFHDLGKAHTKWLDSTDYATYRGHSNLSAHYFLNYLALTKYKEEDIPDWELDILESIHQHMNFHNGIGKKNKVNNILNPYIMTLGHRFAKIDSMSKITERE